MVEIKDFPQNEGKFDKFFEQLGEVQDETGIEQLSVLLSLPDDEFELIAPIFLNELEKELNNSNERIALIQAMKMEGATTDDIIASYAALADELDKQVGDEISQQKIDFIKQMSAIVVNAINDADGVSKRTIEIPIEFCHPDAKMPQYANMGDAGLDVFALDDYIIMPGETKLIPTGIKVAIPKGYELQVRPKSGRSLKTKLRVANTPGTIDSGYRDEVCVIVENIDAPIKDFNLNEDGTIKGILYGSSYSIGKGEKFAQLVLSEVPTASFYRVESVKDIDADDRGGGFGSTGLK